MSLAVGIDLGGTNTKLAVVDHEFRVLAQRSIPTCAESGPGAVITVLGETISALLDECKSDLASVVGVGLATPGPLSLREGRIIHAANLPGWRDVPIREALANPLGLPVVLENDGNAAAFGEHVAGAGLGCQHLVVLTLGTGVGAGVIVDGRILHGHFDNAAELGHMIVVVDGLPCPCGQRGCLERYSSADAIVRRSLGTAAVRERGRNVSPPLVGGAQAGAIPQTAAEVADGAEKGDTLCAQVWDDACKYLAVACVNIQHAFNPQRILLAGGLSLAGDMLLDPVQRHLHAQAWKLHTDLPEIALAKLGSDAGVIGAAALAFRSLPSPA